MSATRKSATAEAAEPRWLTKAEAAAYTRYSERVIQDAINNPATAVPLPALKVSTSGHVRIKSTDLDAWLEARAAWVERQESAS